MGAGRGFGRRLSAQLVVLLVLAGLVAVPGLDLVFVDMEHVPFDTSQMRNIVAAFRRPDGSFPVTPIFRIPANCSEVDKNQ